MDRHEEAFGKPQEWGVRVQGENGWRVTVYLCSRDSTGPVSYGPCCLTIRLRRQGSSLSTSDHSAALTRTTFTIQALGSSKNSTGNK